MPWYRSGKVSVTSGQTTVAGASTDFALNARVGDAFQGPDGQWYEVANIASSSVLSILPAYQGPTVSAGSYGLAPMQGYVKEAADRLRQLVEQFGSTLALLGTPADAAGLRQNIGAAGLGANSDITSIGGLTTALSISQGGTGGKNQAEARTGLGLRSAAVADIVGAVSQAGGVPTGAIIERGSNSNGEYIKFADGTMICRHSGIQTAPAANAASFITVNLPSTFVSSAFSICLNVTSVSAVNEYGGYARASPASSSTFVLLNYWSVSQTYTYQYIAFGRWF